MLNNVEEETTLLMLTSNPTVVTPTSSDVNTTTTTTGSSLLLPDYIVPDIASPTPTTVAVPPHIAPTVVSKSDRKDDDEGLDINISKLVLINNVSSQKWKRSTPLKTYSKKSPTNLALNSAAVSRYGRSHKPRISDDFLSTDKKVSQYLKIDTDNQLHYFKSIPYAVYKSPNVKNSPIAASSPAAQSHLPLEPRKRGRPRKIRPLLDPNQSSSSPTAISTSPSSPTTPSSSSSLLNTSVHGSSLSTSIIGGSTSGSRKDARRSSIDFGASTIKSGGIGDKVRRTSAANSRQPITTNLNVPTPTSTQTLPLPPELMDQAILISSDNEESEQLPEIKINTSTIVDDDETTIDPLMQSPTGTTVEIGPDGEPRWMVGDLAWACVGGFPYWPCTVTRDPFENAFTKLKFVGKFRLARDLIHVRFFGDHGRRSWIYKGNILPFLGLDAFQTLAEQKCSAKLKKKFPKLYKSFTVSTSVRKAWQAAVSEAESLREAPRSERVKYFTDSFPLPVTTSTSLSPDTSLITPTKTPGKRGRKPGQVANKNDPNKTTPSSRKRKSDAISNNSSAKKFKNDIKVNEDAKKLPDDVKIKEELIDDDDSIVNVEAVIMNDDSIKIKIESESPDKKGKNKIKKVSKINTPINQDIVIGLSEIKKETPTSSPRSRGRPRKYPKVDDSNSGTPTLPKLTTAAAAVNSTGKKKVIRKSINGNKKIDINNSINKNGSVDKKSYLQSSQQQTKSTESSSATVNVYGERKKTSKLGPGFASFCEKHFDQVADEEPTLTEDDVNRYLEKMWTQLSDAVKAGYRSKTQEEVEVESESDLENDSRRSPPQTATSGSKPVKRVNRVSGMSLFSGVKSDKVCSVCFKSGEIIKCKGPCCNYFHLECSNLPRYRNAQTFLATTHLRKKGKRGRPRILPKVPEGKLDNSETKTSSSNGRDGGDDLDSTTKIEEDSSRIITDENTKGNAETCNINAETPTDNSPMEVGESNQASDANERKETEGDKNDEAEKTNEIMVKEEVAEIKGNKDKVDDHQTASSLAASDDKEEDIEMPLMDKTAKEDQTEEISSVVAEENLSDRNTTSLDQKDIPTVEKSIIETDAPMEIVEDTSDVPTSTSLPPQEATIIDIVKSIIADKSGVENHLSKNKIEENILENKENEKLAQSEILESPKKVSDEGVKDEKEKNDEKRNTTDSKMEESADSKVDETDGAVKEVLNNPDVVQKNDEKEKQVKNKNKENKRKKETSVSTEQVVDDVKEEATEDDKSEEELKTEIKKDSSNDDKQSIDSDKSQDKQSVDSDKSQTSKSGWMCSLCSESKDGPCFICGSDTGELVRCSTTYCGKVFHMTCLTSWPQKQIGQSAKGKLILYCPQHACHTCISDNPGANTARFGYDKFVRCVACPSSYHYGNHCIPAGSELLSTTQMICPRHYVPLKDSLIHVNASWCSICAIGGSLICCDTCPNSFHAECLKIDPPEGSFICEDCETGRIPLYGEVVWVKLGAYRWWPAKILYPLEVPDNIRVMNHSPVGEFVVEFFGSHDYFWINRGRAFFYHEGDGANILCKSRVDELFITGMNEASEAFRQYQEERESREASSRPSMKPPKYVKIQTNRPYGLLRSAESDVASMTACECDPDKENPCGRNSDCINRLLMVECNPQICPAGDKCQNQNFEKRLYPPLTPFRTENRGWGLQTLVPLKKGDFVIEYVGEMIDEEEYKRRVIRKQKNNDENYYFLTIDKDRMLDAGPKGNMARFMNHSCKPNCETQKWTVNGGTRVGLFTLVDIPAGTELVFNYNLETIGNTRVDCKCGAPLCGGYIGAKVGKPEERKTTIGKSNSVTTNSKKKKQPKKSVANNNGSGSGNGGNNRNSSAKVTENACFTCGDGGELLLCDHGSCPKAYHLDCLGLTKHPPGNWECPRHVCSICSSTKVQRCTHCINSYCDKHAEGNITLHRTHGLVCFSCTPSESGSDWSGEASEEDEECSSKKQEIQQGNSTRSTATTTTTTKNYSGNSNHKGNKLLTSRRGRPLIPNGNHH